METKHTPTPWLFNREKSEIYSQQESTGTFDNGQRIIAKTFVDASDYAQGKFYSEPNAKLIVKAVNMHEELVGALKDLVSICELEDKYQRRIIRENEMSKAIELLKKLEQYEPPTK